MLIVLAHKTFVLSPVNGLTHSVPEHSAENIIFARIWGGRPGIETGNASNRHGLMII